MLWFWSECTVFGRPFVKPFARCYRTAVLSVCLSSLSVCNVGVYWPKGWMDQDETGQGGRPRPWPHCVRWRPSSPLPKGAQPPILAHDCCGQTAGWIMMPLDREIGLGPRDIVSDGDPALSSERGTAPPLFGPCLFWQNGRPSQLLLSSCL